MIRIGLVDLDTTHPKAFTKILNGMGGGSIPGNINAQNSCCSNER